MAGAALPIMARRHPSRGLPRLIRRALLAFGLAALAATPALSDIKSARFEDPTTRYDHAVLGDNIEWGTLALTTASGKTLRLVLPEDRVFEDLEPRLFDVDQDGALEAVVVESSQTAGARLSIYDESGLVAATPYIGQRNRWLAPVGAADFDGDGSIELAYVDRPHLAKTLRVWRIENGALIEIARLGGVTNHRIGEDFISGGVRDCGDGPEMIVADARWRDILAVRLTAQTLSTQKLAPFQGRDSFAPHLACDTP